MLNISPSIPNVTVNTNRVKRAEPAQKPMREWQFQDNSGFLFSIYAENYAEACKLARAQIYA